MRLREIIRRLFRRFESALTRVEDQGVRIEKGVDRMVELGTELNDALGQLKYDVAERNRRQDDELVGLKNRLSVVERSIGSGNSKH